MSEITTVSMKRATKDRLARVGNKDESYDAVINKVIDGYLRCPEKF